MFIRQAKIKTKWNFQQPSFNFAKWNLDSLDNIILGGDLNCPLDPLLDKKAEQVQKRSQLSLVSTVPKIINKYEEGGLRMVDLECMVKSLRLAWWKRSFSGTNGTWKSYLQHIVSSVGGLFFFNCNYNISDYTIPSQFYQELLLWWSQFRETFATEEDWKTIIWNNKEIKVENKPVYYKHYVNARVICIQVLLFSSLNSTDSYNQLSKNVCKTNILEWAGFHYR